MNDTANARVLVLLYVCFIVTDVETRLSDSGGVIVPAVDDALLASASSVVSSPSPSHYSSSVLSSRCDGHDAVSVH